MSSETIRPGGRSDAGAIETITCDDWRAAIALHGDLDIACTPELHAELARHLEAGRHLLRIDTAAVTFIDSTVIGELVEASNRCHDAHGSLILTNVPARVRQVIKMAGLEDVLLVEGPNPSSSAS